MSAYVVEDETINRIVAWLERDKMGSDPIANYILKDHGYTCAEEFERLAHDLFQLNVQAVDARYGPGEAAKFRPLDFEYSSAVKWGDSRISNACRALKALQCLIYQCSEGDVPESAPYRMLRDIESAIARWIVSTMPEYEMATWG